eukprot:2584344-Amphidinium_carterae.1
MYLRALYQSCGRHLRRVQLDDTNTWGPFSIDGSTIKLNCPLRSQDDENSLQCSALEGSLDWVWKDQWSFKVHHQTFIQAHVLT